MCTFRICHEILFYVFWLIPTKYIVCRDFNGGYSHLTQYLYINGNTCVVSKSKSIKFVVRIRFKYELWTYRAQEMKRVNVRNGVVHSRTSKVCTWLLNPAGRPWNLRILPISNTSENTASHEAIHIHTHTMRKRRQGTEKVTHTNVELTNIKFGYKHTHNESQRTVNREN